MLAASLDIAVNAVGRNHRKSLLETTQAELDEMTAVQFVGPFLFMQAVVSGMKDCKRGESIIQISSVTSMVMLHDQALYMGTKAGVDHMVRAVAYDYGVDGIRVNSISPGPTSGVPMAAYVFQNQPFVEQLKLAYPLRRIGTVADVAEAAVWLAEDACFLTGQFIRVTGGSDLAGRQLATETLGLLPGTPFRTPRPTLARLNRMNESIWTYTLEGQIAHFRPTHGDLVAIRQFDDEHHRRRHERETAQHHCCQGCRITARTLSALLN